MCKKRSIGGIYNEMYRLHSQLRVCCDPGKSKSLRKRYKKLSKKWKKLAA